jgi:trk system potassium uptake protein TrkH
VKTKRRFTPSTTGVILLSFLAVILLGSALLSLPISAADGCRVPFVDALFTATTATCVTGLVTLPVVTTWSTFGQAVLLVLIQIGGLGVITVMSGFMVFLHYKMRLGDRMLIQDSFNLNTMAGLADFIKRVLLGTLTVEGVGALLYMTVFVPDFGARGIWVAVFTAVSAFCNAGIDIIATDSLCSYVHDPVINAVTCLLIVLGGLGYIVWWDVLRVLRDGRRQKWQRLTLHSKIVLSVTAVLMLGGAVLFLILEYRNPLTIGTFSLPQKIGASLFQSVTTRTAGFATVSQKGLSNGSAILSLLLMFIGGSPVGTAGGIKTVTLAVLIASTLAAVREKDSPTLFHRSLSRQAVGKALAVAVMAITIVFVSSLLLAAVTEAPALDVLYETVSAAATVGLTRDLTPALNTAGKWIVIVTMYLGRVGPISLAILFNTKKKQPDPVKNPVEEISVG